MKVGERRQRVSQSGQMQMRDMSRHHRIAREHHAGVAAELGFEHKDRDVRENENRVGGSEAMGRLAVAQRNHCLIVTLA